MNLNGIEMDCREFSTYTKAFIYSEITDNKIIKQYMEHARECSDCADELEVIYSMHRALGDIQDPDGNDNSSDYISELKEIFVFYDDKIYNQKTDEKMRIIVAVVIAIIGIVFILLTVWSLLN